MIAEWAGLLMCRRRAMVPAGRDWRSAGKRLSMPHPRAIRGACFRYWIVVDGRQVHHVKVAEDRS